MLYAYIYQLDFDTPGISPFDANSLKQIRQRLNFLMYALGRPQTLHRRIIRDEYFGFLLALTIIDFLAILLLYPV